MSASEDLFAAPRGRQDRIVLATLIAAGGPVSRDALLEAMYPGDSRKHVTHAEGVVRVVIHRLRKDIRPFGYAISSNIGGTDGPGKPRVGVYELLPLEGGVRTPAMSGACRPPDNSAK